MSSLEQRIAGLSPEKRALLERRLQTRDLGAMGDGRIPRRDSTGPCPLSFSQERLWFLNQIEPDNPNYNMSKAIRMAGKVDLGVLQQVLDAVVARHEALRTTFAVQDGAPVQVVGASRPVALPVTGLGQRPGAGDEPDEARVQRWLAAETQRPFDLTKDLMLRASLLRLSEEEHILLLVTHHIASDGWSTSVLFRELSALYAAFAQGEPSPLAPLPIQYADYAVWQRQRFQGAAAEAQLAYWRQRLTGAPTVLDLPANRPRPAVQSALGARQSLVLSAALTEGLRALGREEQATLFMVLLGAFNVLLHRYTRQEDILVGSPVAGRERVETEGLIGFFVNDLVLRTDLTGNPTFRELLRRTRQTTLEAYSHQEVPFERLVAELRPERDLSRNPLFQVALAFQNVPRSALELSELTLSPIELDKGTTLFDVTLYVTEDEDGLTTTAEYSTDLFDAATISRMLGHFQMLLEGMVVHPDQPVATLPILTQAEREQRAAINATKAPVPEVLLHSLLAAQVAQRPQQPAVIHPQRTLTYEALFHLSNRVGRRLRELGARPNQPVAIVMEKGWEQIVAALGVLQSGAPYLPIDSRVPTERLTYLLTNGEVELVLTQAHLDGALQWPRNVRRLCVDSEEIANTSSQALEPAQQPDDLACLIYTSGSTGLPKGVMVTHRGVINSILYTNQFFRISAADRVLALTALHHDLSFYDIFGMLAAGGSIVVPEASKRLDPAHWSALMVREGVTLWNSVPAMLEMLLEYAESRPGAVPDSLRLAFLGGDWIPLTTPGRLKQQAGRAQVVSTGGPTETTLWNIWYPVESVDPAWKSIPYGKPIANTQYHVLNEALADCPTHVVGELCCVGVGVTKGYWRDEERTRAKYVLHPRTGERMYRTGDMGRYLPDGNIEFMGREDFQVKIRGMRIELGEVEAALVQHPEVKQAVARVLDRGAGDRVLVAYVVASRPPPPAAGDLRGFVKTKLPDYMVPSSFIFLDAMPLNPNGKVDRKALPLPTVQHRGPEETPPEPQTPLESRIAAIWREVLGLERVGRDDNFFDLGGHSLLATRVVSRLNDAFQVEVPLRRIFEAPTVAATAETIEALLWGAQGAAGATAFPDGPREEIEL
ncbi:MAG TPA: amino acid adenylation domain-containing protein [Dehalococcoidia bacterium]|nr:amino acid adenylation domain-containing protein [Dehalococcoidia bacterium]